MDYLRVKEMVADIGLSIVDEVPEEELVVIEDESRGIKGMIVDCEGDILIIEQPIGKFSEKYYKWFLEQSRFLPFGAFVLDNESETILFRNTLRLDTLDLEEFESTINSLEIFFSEHGDTLIKMSREN
ncbi:hypothetical protein JCM13304A_03590 [Desulfothermus okinawensis JCM 13304]